MECVVSQQSEGHQLGAGQNKIVFSADTPVLHIKVEPGPSFPPVLQWVWGLAIRARPEPCLHFEMVNPAALSKAFCCSNLQLVSRHGIEHVKQNVVGNTLLEDLFHLESPHLAVDFGIARLLRLCFCLQESRNSCVRVS